MPKCNNTPADMIAAFVHRPDIFFVCLLLPDELATYLRYVRRLDFFETPDYDYLRKLFLDLMAKKNWECDWEFDWTGRQMVSPTLST